MTNEKGAAAPSSALALRDPATGRLIPLRHGLAVGRAFGELVLNDQPTVSRRHGEFRVADDVIAFSQAEVRNPARLNGVPIASGCAVVVRAGDQLQFGTKIFEVVAPAGSGPAAPPAAQPEAPAKPLSTADTQPAGPPPIDPSIEPKPIEPIEGDLSTPSGLPVSHSDGFRFEPPDRGMAEVSAVLGDGSVDLSYAPEPRRAGALVAIACASLAGFAFWRTIGPLGEASMESAWRGYLAAAICAAVPLALVRLLWTSTSARIGASPVWAGAALALFCFGLASSLPAWTDEITGVFSQTQAASLAAICEGESFQSGPCADLYAACGPRCRKHALPLLAGSSDGGEEDPLRLLAPVSQEGRKIDPINAQSPMGLRAEGLASPPEAPLGETATGLPPLPPVPSAAAPAHASPDSIPGLPLPPAAGVSIAPGPPAVSGTSSRQAAPAPPRPTLSPLPVPSSPAPIRVAPGAVRAIRPEDLAKAGTPAPPKPSKPSKKASMPTKLPPKAAATSSFPEPPKGERPRRPAEQKDK